MTRFSRRAVIAFALLALGSASPARADFSFSGSDCGGSNFSTCASVSVQWKQIDADTWQATLTVTNLGAAELGSAEAVFAAVGISNLPEGYTWDNKTTGDFGDWTPAPPNNLSGDGIEPQVAQLNAPNPWAHKGLEVGDASLTFVFEFSGLTTQQAMATGVGIHAISGPNCSTKLNFGPDGQITNSPTSYTGCGASTVPEPATIGLLTTGLLGLGGVGFLRRRKKA